MREKRNHLVHRCLADFLAVNAEHPSVRMELVALGKFKYTLNADLHSPERQWPGLVKDIEHRGHRGHLDPIYLVQSLGSPGVEDLDTGGCRLGDKLSLVRSRGGG